MRQAMRLAVLLVAGLLPGLAQAQSPCAYGARECYDGRDNTDRANHDDLANRTKVLAVSTTDITDRANHDDLANRTKILAVSTGDITDRANHDDLTDRTRACP